MTGWAAETIALVLLAICLAGAVLRPRQLNEAVFGVPAAIIVVVTGIVPWHAALDRLGQLSSTVAFLAGILVFGHLCAEAGVFDYLGAVAARAARGSPSRLLALVVALAAAVTAVLTLDATVVLLTPVVLRTAHRLRTPPRPHAYACTQLANAGSLLLPVSNLTNLLAFTAAAVPFGTFAALMALPWIAASAGEWAGLRMFFRRDLRDDGTVVDAVPPAPRYALTVLGLAVVGFVVTSAVDVPAAWAALGGVLLLGVPALVRGRTRVPALVREANLGFCVFVFCLGVVVEGVTRHGLGTGIGHLLPAGDGLLTLLAIAAVAAVLANLVNNLPATLAMVPLTAAHPVAVLAVLVGVNIGPNLTYAGSLATLLWRRLLPERVRPRAGEFHLYGALSVPPLIVLCTVLLWAGSRVLGID